MAWDSIPRTHCFSLSDFHDFDRCVFKFFVNHHLQKKYELAEGSEKMAIGTLLDLAIKKLHTTKAYNQPVDYLQNLIKAAEMEIRYDVEKQGKSSFYGAQIPFLSDGVINQTKDVFKNYILKLQGEYKYLVKTPTMLKPRPFWSYVIESKKPLKLWGGPDSIEIGEDEVPEVVDYKYIEDPDSLDMDLMPKLYMLLCTKELKDMGFKRARFKIRLWREPKNEDYYEEFDLDSVDSFKTIFQDKIEKILDTKELSFCQKPYCKVCNSSVKDGWIEELKSKGFIDR